MTFELDGETYEVHLDGDAWWVMQYGKLCTVHQWRLPGFQQAASDIRRRLLSAQRRQMFRKVLFVDPKTACSAVTPPDADEHEDPAAVDP